MPIASNPFSTRNVKPGMIPFLGLDASSILEMATKLMESHAMTQIVGPHGAGKTTLTFAIQDQLNQLAAAAGKKLIVRRFTVGAGKSIRSIQGTVPIDDGRNGDASLLFVVDGIERMGFLQQLGFLNHCRTHDYRLLATTHRPLKNLQVIHRIDSKAETLVQLVAYLSSELQGQAGFRKSDLECLFNEQNGDLRECLMQLYDRFESQCRPHI